MTQYDKGLTRLKTRSAVTVNQGITLCWSLQLSRVSSECSLAKSIVDVSVCVLGHMIQAEELPLACRVTSGRPSPVGEVKSGRPSPVGEITFLM
jgi:hypothetical protein